MRGRRSPLQAYVNRAKDILGLGHWEIEVSEEQVEDPSTDYAHIDPNDFADSAVVRFGPKFWAADEETKRRTIAHELAHLHAYRTTNFVESLQKLIAPPTWGLFFEEFEKKEDMMIESLAKLFAPMLPRLPRISAPRVKESK